MQRGAHNRGLSPQTAAWPGQWEGRIARRRGSALILAVAVLGLLVVMGTVYIVSSRAERNSAQAMSTAVNLDWAQQAVNEQVRQTISDSMFDAGGILGGYGHKGSFGSQA